MRVPALRFPDRQGRLLQAVAAEFALNAPIATFQPDHDLAWRLAWRLAWHGGESLTLTRRQIPGGAGGVVQGMLG